MQLKMNGKFNIGFQISKDLITKTNSEKVWNDKMKNTKSLTKTKTLILIKISSKATLLIKDLNYTILDYTTHYIMIKNN